MSVKIWQGGWQQGNSVTLGVGKHYGAELSRLGVLDFRSMHVADGYAAKVHVNGDFTSYWRG